MTLFEAFEILGLPPTSSEEEVNRAYRNKAMMTHPDVASDKALGESMMTTLNLARDRALEHAHSKAKPMASSGPCIICDDKKKVKTTRGWTSVEVDCPACTAPAVDD